MAKSSPEKLAAALKANLKRRKQTKQAQSPEPPAHPVAEARQKPQKTAD